MRKRPSADRFRPPLRGVVPASQSGEARIAGRSSLPVLLAAAVAALLLIWLVARISAANALLEDSGDSATAWAPNHPEILLELANDELQTTGDPSPETVSAAF